jgi:CBS-domain-containing membrane protein
MGGTKDYKICISRASLAFFITIIVIAALQTEHVLVFSSFAASIFIIVTMPSMDVANVRNVVGGHMLGLFSGVMVSLVTKYAASSSVFYFAFAVGLATFLMNVFDVQHPPAAGTALGVSMSGVSFNVFVSVFTSVFILGIVMMLVRKTNLSVRLYCNI